MTLSIILSTLLSTFATSTPSLCDVVYLDALGVPLTDAVGQTLARYCKWTGPDAPIWRADVCCTIDADGAACSKVGAGAKCPNGAKRWFCEHGAVDALGGVTCYQPFPDGCAAGMCVDAPDLPPPSTEFVMCCSPGGACQHVDEENIFDCEAQLQWCNYGSMDGNGVVECWG